MTVTIAVLATRIVIMVATTMVTVMIELVMVADACHDDRHDCLGAAQPLVADTREPT